MPEATDPINFIPEELLNKEETKSGPLAIVFDWTIASGRKILVVVATIVITIFFIRIKIDSDISKSIEKISVQEAKILSMSQIEKEHIQIQKKLALIKSVKSNEINWSERFNKFSGSIPRDITIEKITYTKSNVKFSATANSSSSFSIFLAELISDKQIKDILLTASKYIPADKSYTFSMEVTLNE